MTFMVDPGSYVRNFISHSSENEQQISTPSFVKEAILAPEMPRKIEPAQLPRPTRFNSQGHEGGFRFDDPMAEPASDFEAIAHGPAPGIRLSPDRHDDPARPDDTRRRGELSQ